MLLIAANQKINLNLDGLKEDVQRRIYVNNRSRKVTGNLKNGVVTIYQLFVIHSIKWNDV